jgi:glycosyltransferase involved in cell wall biosynthesis
MPVYNAEKYIGKTLDTILNQTFKDFELILVDDCGSDDSVNIVKKYSDSRMKLIRNDGNKGIAYSRNAGMMAASGKYIALMDDDDLAPINRLETEFDFLENHPEIDAVGGRYCTIDEWDNILSYSTDTLQNPKFVRASLMFYDPIGNGSMMFRKKTVEKNGLAFKDNWLGMEDYLFWVDFSMVGAITNVKEVMLHWRHIDGNETNRVLKEKSGERAEKFAQIQKYALKANGFDLSDGDLEFLTAMLPEGRLVYKVMRDDLERLYRILGSVISQAEQMNNQSEIKIACRKQFSRRLECSEVWM